MFVSSSMYVHKHCSKVLGGVMFVQIFTCTVYGQKSTVICLLRLLVPRDISVFNIPDHLLW